MVLKKGRFGPFYACTAYPACTFTKPATKTETTDKKCDKCGSPMVVRQG
ncbi:MAG TPA: topoisomerase DNA-binding C4 zinc finger domain-containing protein, partial [Deltaproteobacteria bacterium]|nr:topoisomerase DNA-binding C4 zinc finger domain-containing protein [Deltaproteobacteria bacterium]